MCSDDTATAAFNPVYQAHLGLIMARMSKKKKKKFTISRTAMAEWHMRIQTRHDFVVTSDVQGIQHPM